MKVPHPIPGKGELSPKQTPSMIGSDRSKNGSKHKARSPSKPQGNQPAGGGKLL